MDSKSMKRIMLAMIGMFLVLVAVIALTNLDMVKQKLGLSVQEQAQEAAATEETDIDSGQIGNDLSGFLNDETFFDPEVKFKSIETYSGKNVSMVMSSVAKDLRIMIVDSVGNLVTGAPFTIQLNFLTKPDFIAYNHKFWQEPGRRICRRLYRCPAAAWTIQSQGDLEAMWRNFDVFIFDSFCPIEAK